MWLCSQATVEAVMDQIKRHEEFAKRMDANDEKINQMIQFAQRLADDNHYAAEKITEKAQSIDERLALLFMILYDIVVSFFGVSKKELGK